MARRKRPASGRAAAAVTSSSGDALGATSAKSASPGQATNRSATSKQTASRRTMRNDTTTRQLTLPLAAAAPPRADAHLAVAPAMLPAMAGARAFPPLPSLASLAATHVAPLPDERPAVSPGGEPGPARPPVPSAPREGRAPVHARLDDVRSALADGWEIVQPIFARPLWSVADNSITAFNFVLRRERATRLVTIPEGRGVQRFIRDHHLSVDYRN